MKKIILISLFIIITISIYSQNIYDSYLDSINYYYEQNDYPEIMRISSLLINTDTTRYEGFYYKALAYYKLNNLEKANKYCKKSLELTPSMENTYLHLLILKKSDNSQYLNHINNALYKFPGREEFLKLKAIYFANHNTLDSAYIYAQQVLVNKNNDEECLFIKAKYLDSVNDYKNSLNIYKTLASFNKKKYYYELGIAYTNNNMFTNAISMYKKLINSKYDYKAKINIADCYYSLKKYDSTKIYLKMLINNYNDSIKPYTNLIAIYEKTKNDSIINFLKLHNPIEKNILIQVYDNIGSVLYMENKYEDASYFYKEILRNDSLYFSKNATMTFLSNNQFEDVINILNNYKINDKNDIFLYKYRGIAYFKLKDYKKSEINFKNAYNIIPKDTVIIFNYCNTLYVNHKDGELLGIIDSIKLWNPDFSNKLMNTFFPNNKIDNEKNN